MSNLKRDEILLLFDVDGTLTPARKSIESDFEEFLYTKVKTLATLGVVGGSDLSKIQEQLKGERMLKEFDYVFPENGLIHIENGKEVSRQSIQKHLGEPTLKRIINFCLRYFSELDIPVKRGNFIEFRSGMLNVCPIGRQCTYEERLEFNKYDQEHHVREKMVEDLRKEFADVDLTFSIGGQISIDIFPRGWDKTYCLNHVINGTKCVKSSLPTFSKHIILNFYFSFKEIHFFGDKTEEGGNDFEIFSDARTIGHKVVDPSDTCRQLKQLFGI